MGCIPYLMKFTTENKNAVREYIYVYVLTTPSEFYYASSINPQRIKLDLVYAEENKDKYIEYDHKVSFPGDSRRYYLDWFWDKNQIICTNPDGSKQIFYHEG